MLFARAETAGVFGKAGQITHPRIQGGLAIADHYQLGARAGDGHIEEIPVVLEEPERALVDSHRDRRGEDDHIPLGALKSVHGIDQELALDQAACELGILMQQAPQLVGLGAEGSHHPEGS